MVPDIWQRATFAASAVDRSSDCCDALASDETPNEFELEIVELGGSPQLVNRRHLGEPERGYWQPAQDVGHGRRQHLAILVVGNRCTGAGSEGGRPQPPFGFHFGGEGEHRRDRGPSVQAADVVRRTDVDDHGTDRRTGWLGPLGAVGGDCFQAGRAQR